MQLRSTDSHQIVRFRSDRFFNTNGSWFFHTREGTIEGPYLSRNDGESGLRQYIATVTGRPLPEEPSSSLTA